MAEFQKAVFNEGFLQSQRLNELQHDINNVRVNPLAFNLDKNCYNYEVWFMDLCSLYSEAIGKLDNNEINDLEYIKKMINTTLKYKKPHINVINQFKNESTTRINRNNWDFLRTLLEIFEKQVKISLNNHGLSNPDIEGGDMF